MKNLRVIENINIKNYNNFIETTYVFENNNVIDFFHKNYFPL